MEITTVGIDLAKSVFQIHAVDERGKAVLRKQLKRSEMANFFANLPSCLIGMEACAGAHHWARKLIVLGHEVRLMAPHQLKAGYMAAIVTCSTKMKKRALQTGERPYMVRSQNQILERYFSSTTCARRGPRTSSVLSATKPV